MAVYSAWKEKEIQGRRQGKRGEADCQAKWEEENYKTVTIIRNQLSDEAINLFPSKDNDMFSTDCISVSFPVSSSRTLLTIIPNPV